MSSPLATLLPPNATPVERAIEAATARLAEVAVPLRRLVDPDTCTLTELSFLAWSLSIDHWNPAWPEAVKRARVKAAISIQRRKGTLKSVEDVVATFGGHVAIREWWETDPPGTPHTFALVLNVTGVDGDAPTADYIDDVIAEVTKTKPLRSHFTFEQGFSAFGRVGLVGAARVANYYRLSFEAPAGTPVEPLPVLRTEEGAAILTEDGHPIEIEVSE
jgi:phage tail P2-like protein